MEKPTITIIGAGASGRGHLGQMLFKEGFGRLVYVDNKPWLVDALNAAGCYDVRLLQPGGGPEHTCRVTGAAAVHRQDEAAVIACILESDVVLTCVIAENLPDVSSVVAKALAEKADRNDTKPLNIIGCENLENASSYLKKLVWEKLDTTGQDFCGRYVGFPDAMISRVVPIPAEGSLEIVAEDYNEWTVDKAMVCGPLPAIGSIDWVVNLPARLERKLWIHNGGHAALAYAASLKSIQYVHEALQDVDCLGLALKVLDELGDCIIHKYGLDEASIRAYEADLGRRGAIAEMKDEIRRVVRDPLRKLNRHDRLLAPALYAWHNGLSCDAILQAIVNATRYQSPDDAESMRMAAIIGERGVDYFLAHTLELADEPELAAAIAAKHKAEPA